MDAVITAGGIPLPSDPLYTYSMGESKALIDVAGKPMIQWVLDALGDAKTIDRVVVIGLTEKSGLSCSKPIHFLSNQGRLLENLKAGTARVMELNPKAKYVLFVSSDIPGITGQIVDWVVNTCMQTSHDLYYNVVRRESMEDRFPTSRRTYTRLKDMEVCGGDLNMARASIVKENSLFWNKLIEARKNPAAQASLIGVDIVLKFILRQLTVDDVIGRLAGKLNIKGRAIVCPYPELGMDVDKPHQLEIMRAYLAGRTTSAGSASRTGRKKPSVKQLAPRAAKRTAKRPSAGSGLRGAKKATPKPKTQRRKK